VVGWNLLALLDGEAAGAVLPAAVRTEFGTVGGDLNTHALDGHRNDTDGSFDYDANTSEVTAGSVAAKNLARTSIGLQGLYFVGEIMGARVNLTVNEINNYFPSGAPAGSGYACGNSTYNLGCGYGMFNAFKALKLLGIQTLPSVGRAAGPGTIPANDWYAFYVDWLIAKSDQPHEQHGGILERHLLLVQRQLYRRQRGDRRVDPLACGPDLSGPDALRHGRLVAGHPVESVGRQESGRHRSHGDGDGPEQHRGTHSRRNGQLRRGVGPEYGGHYAPCHLRTRVVRDGSRRHRHLDVPQQRHPGNGYDSGQHWHVEFE
jgi:hypothetical protein